MKVNTDYHKSMTMALETNAGPMVKKLAQGRIQAPYTVKHSKISVHD